MAGYFYSSEGSPAHMEHCKTGGQKLYTIKFKQQKRQSILARSSWRGKMVGQNLDKACKRMTIGSE